MKLIKKYFVTGVLGVLTAFLLVKTTSLIVTPLSSVKLIKTESKVTSKIVDNAIPTPAPSGPPLLGKRQISVVSPNPSRSVYLVGEVASNALEIAAQITRLGQESLDPIFLVETSPGGSVLAGGQIIAAMESSPAPVYTVCHFLCASMAAMIFEYGQKRYIGDRSFVMFHPASGSAEGELDKMISRMGSMQRYIGKMEAYAANRAKLTFEQYKARSHIEAWIDGEDAVNSGFADYVATVHLPANSPLSGELNAKSIYEAIFKRKEKTQKNIDYNWITPVEELQWLR